MSLRSVYCRSALAGIALLGFITPLQAEGKMTWTNRSKDVWVITFNPDGYRLEEGELTFTAAKASGQ